MSRNSTSRRLTVQESQIELALASKQYFNGEISEARLHEMEAEFEIDYAKVFLEQVSVFSEITSILKRWFGQFKQGR